jgi:hypothetical protein
MSFTTIPLEQPIVITPVPEKVFDRKWISHIRINSTPETGSKIIIHDIPFSGTETLPGPINQTVIENIFDDIQNTEQPEALRTLKATTMELIFQLFNAETAYRKFVESERIRLEEERLAAEESDEEENSEADSEESSFDDSEGLIEP